VRRRAVLKHKHKLVLGAVKGTHTPVILNPDTDVLELSVNILCRVQQFTLMTPVHEDVVDGSRLAEPNQVLTGGLQQARKLGLRQITGGHNEVAVLSLTKTADIPGPHIIRRINDNDVDDLIA